MNKKHIILVTILIFLCTTGFFNPFACNTIVRGTVTDSATGDPIESATVTIEGYTPVTTGIDGTYTFEGIPCSRVITITTTCAGYNSSSFSVETTSFQGITCEGTDVIPIILTKEESSESNIATKIIVTASPITISADGTSTSMITARVSDADNLLVTTATNQVTFSMSGPGTILGTTIKSASSGMSTVMMQSTTTAGTATVTATASNLIQGIVNIVTAAITSEMVLIPAGNFSMGSTVEVDEQPVHTIYLDTYYIDKYEVTNCLYKVFIDGGGYDNSAYWTTDGWTWKTNNSITQPYYWDDSTFGYNATDGPNLPVVGVSWYEAYAYANWAGKRLPTEAEWEKAARGTDERPYPWGEGIDSSKLNYNDNIGHTTVVGSYETGKSPYGCYDMAGNVWEWCNDWYDASYYSSSPTNNPQGPGTGATRVFRGGSWNYDDNNCRSANRNWYYPNYRDYGFGFRCASGVVQ